MTLVCKDEAGVEYSPLVKDPGKGFLRPYFTFAGDLYLFFVIFYSCRIWRNSFVM